MDLIITAIQAILLIPKHLSYYGPWNHSHFACFILSNIYRSKLCQQHSEVFLWEKCFIAET